MMLSIPAGATTLALLALATVPPMTDEAPALTLDVRHHDGLVEVQLIGLSPRVQAVSYEIEITGNSTSRHRGSTTLAAGTRAVLSTMKTRTGDDWCVRLTAEEEGRAPYEITRGTCAGD